MQEKLYGKSIIVADRETVEEKADDILLEASSSDVAFLVVGDPFGYSFILTKSQIYGSIYLFLYNHPKRLHSFIGF